MQYPLNRDMCRDVSLSHAYLSNYFICDLITGHGLYGLLVSQAGSRTWSLVTSRGRVSFPIPAAVDRAWTMTPFKLRSKTMTPSQPRLPLPIPTTWPADLSPDTWPLTPTYDCQGPHWRALSREAGYFRSPPLDSWPHDVTHGGKWQKETLKRIGKQSCLFCSLNCEGINVRNMNCDVISRRVLPRIFKSSCFVKTESHPVQCSVPCLKHDVRWRGKWPLYFS